MCTCHTNGPCPCYRSAQEYREERARQAHASRLEHEVLALLRDATASASPLARRFADAIRSDPCSLDGAAVADVLAMNHGILWWLADGSEHCTRLDVRPAIHLVA